jgi:hypothetical protein
MVEVVPGLPDQFFLRITQEIGYPVRDGWHVSVSQHEPAQYLNKKLKAKAKINYKLCGKHAKEYFRWLIDLS